MAYLGKTPSQAVRQRYYFTASGGETSLSGADDNGNTLNFTDGAYVDVYLNGVLLVAGTDYNTSTANTIGGLTALSASDVVELVVYDTFAVFGGEVQGDMTVTNGALKTTDITAVDSNGIQFNTDEGTERVRIDDSGNLLVGQSSSTAIDTSSSITGYSFREDGRGAITRDGGIALALNRNSSDGDILELKKDAVKVGSIGVDFSDNLTIDAGAGESGLNFATSQLCAYRGGANADAAVDLGLSSVRWKDLYLSGGVYLGGTGAANHLDDYEEGTWTPQVLGSTSGTTTYSNQHGSYVKVGKMVSVSGYVNWSSATGTGTMRIYGLPFATGSTSDYLAAGSVFMNNIDIPTGYLTPVMFADINQTFLVIYYTRDNATWQVGQMDGAGSIIFQITYNTDA